jgi:outer membrane protein assembly factor BamB
MNIWLNRNLLLVLMLTAGIAPACADDWPHWMGPGRDNVWREAGIIERFPEGGPRILWTTPIAGGYSGPAVAAGRVVVTDYVSAENVKVDNFERKEFSGMERVHCLDEKTGREIWQHEYPVKYTMSYPAGPRCTPIIHEGKVYTLGGEGNLICFQLESGEVVWQKDLPREYETKTALWGYASHPLIDGQKLICLAGGEGTHVVAFDKETGEEIWRALTSPEQGYSPPTIIEAGGKRQLILLRPDAVTSLDPETGKESWSVPYEATNGSIIMSPIQAGEYLYAGGFSNKNLLLKLPNGAEPGQAPEEVWRDLPRAAVAPVNVQPFRHDNMLYGFDQRGSFVGVELPSGKRLWETGAPLAERPVPSGTAFIVRQADRYWLFTEQGELMIADLSPEGFTEIDRDKVIEPTNTAMGRDVVWSMPAFANRHAYIRNDQQIICVDLAASAASPSSGP